jgi:DNA-binding LytR/AlgR family response regulator
MNPYDLKRMTCIIIEDEIPAQNILRNFIQRVPDLELAGVFKAAIEANTFLNAHKVDLLFLDINLPDMSGLDFIRTVKDPPAVIMCTAYPEHAVQSFELETITDYLVKPFAFERFLKGVNKARERMQRPQNNGNNDGEVIYLNVDKTHHKLKLDHILYIESNRNYVSIVTKEETLTFIDTLKNWKEKLAGKPFIQVHKSFIVNRHAIDKLAGNLLYMGLQRIPVGRSYKTELLEVLGISN